MDTSGRPHEGWMIVIPGTVFLMFVVLALGGPVGFVNTLSLWAVEMASWFSGVAGMTLGLSRPSGVVDQTASYCLVLILENGHRRAHAHEA